MLSILFLLITILTALTQTSTAQFLSMQELQGKKVVLSDEQQAVIDAKSDVDLHFNNVRWFTIGCLFPIVGPMISQSNQKSIPSARLMGKTPEYIAFYTDNYIIEMKKKRYTWSVGGCVLGGAVYGSVIIWSVFRYIE